MFDAVDAGLDIGDDAGVDVAEQLETGGMGFLLSGTVSAAEVRRVAQGLTLATAVLTGTYRRAR